MQQKKNDMSIGKNIDTKLCIVEDIKIVYEGDQIYITGYANTKGVVDSHGDIPMNLNGEPVYDLSRMDKNPVCFVDHWASASNIAGNFVELKEDDRGLFFKLLLRPLKKIFNDQVKDAVSSYIDGFGRALSIGGNWAWGDPENPTHLTKAIIHEISLVGIGSDGSALTDVDYPKNKPDMGKAFTLDDLKEMDERGIEDLLRSGLKFGTKSAKVIISLLKSAGFRDEVTEDHRDGVKEDEIKAMTEKINNIINNIKGD